MIKYIIVTIIVLVAIILGFTYYAEQDYTIEKSTATGYQKEDEFSNKLPSPLNEGFSPNTDTESNTIYFSDIASMNSNTSNDIMAINMVPINDVTPVAHVAPVAPVAPVESIPLADESVCLSKPLNKTNIIICVIFFIFTLMGIYAFASVQKPLKRLDNL